MGNIINKAGQWLVNAAALYKYVTPAKLEEAMA